VTAVVEAGVAETSVRGGSGGIVGMSWESLAAQGGVGSKRERGALDERRALGETALPAGLERMLGMVWARHVDL